MRVFSTLGIAVCLGTLWSGGAVGIGTYVEDFTTTTYKHPTTTADWNTTAGELRLFPFVPTLTGSYATPTNAENVFVSGDYAYVAVRTSGLLVIDISDPTTPSLAGSYNTSGSAYGIFVAGDHAYVGDGSAGLQVIDISDPTTPTLAGTYNTPGDAADVFVAGDHAYVGDGSAGLQVIDISDPTTPALAGSYNTTGSSEGVFVSGDRAYVADGSSGLQVIDISDPTTPTLDGSYNTPDFSYDVVVAGDHAYVADNTTGLLVIDISDPTTPALAGSYNTSGNAFGVVVAGDRAFVADGFSGLQVIDITDPTAPSLKDTYDTLDFARGVGVAGEHVFAACNASLQLVQIGDPVANLAGNYNTPLQAYGVFVSGDYLYVGDESTLQILDISDPTAPTFAGSYDPPGLTRGIHVSGDYAYVADVYSLQIVDVSDPVAPAFAGSLPALANNLGSVVVSGDYAYAADGGAGLLVIDISDPTSPALAGSYNTPNQANDVFVAGDHAYVADGTSLQVIDISDPTSPALAGSYPAGSCTDVFVYGDYAYAATGALVRVIDVTDPTSPSLAGSYGAPSTVTGIFVDGNYAYASAYLSGLQVINIIDPTSPALAGSFGLSGTVYDVVVGGQHAYVANLLNGVAVIRVLEDDFRQNSANMGRSFPVSGATQTIAAVRLTATQNNIVAWELSADNGTNWVPASPGSGWKSLSAGTNLVWRSTHIVATPGVNPAVSQLQIDWLIEPATIDAIVDVPGDQGGWASLYFTRSGRDLASEPTYPIAAYNVHRRVDSAALIAEVLARGQRVPTQPAMDNRPAVPSVGTTLCLDGEHYRVGDGSASSPPPGMWQVVGTVLARQQDQYNVLVPTVGDSSSAIPWSAYYISAHSTTPSVFYESNPDSGYSVDNIAPGVPQGFAVAYNTGSGNQLDWDPAPEPDFQYFRVYRSTDPGFTPGPGNLVHSTANVNWLDTVEDGWQYHYKVTALDHAGNESEPASAGTVTGVEPTGAPERFVLHANIPNPFNPTTTIRYDVPKGAGEVTLRIFDVRGRLVRTLVNGQKSADRYEVSWDGRNDSGQRVATGVYFYRLSAAGFSQTRRMVLLK